MIIKKVLFTLGSFAVLSSCMGDRKTIVGEDLSDTSFVNNDFKTNSINYTEGMSACSELSADEIAQIYQVSVSAVIIDDPLTNPQRRATSTPLCSFYIKSGDNDFQWLRGSIVVEREIGKDEFMGDVAEATGSGTDWVEAWKLKQSMYESTEWVPNLGMAALWHGQQNTLEIKFEGYTLKVHPLINKSNPQEMALSRDYKAAAIAMAKSAGFLN
ncbi:hypothetical protein [Gilvibacter sp.]|uniref:hypothetical protein n=1 Tax=Gilvibacter sp. TaxID=2729997 RepID=UPI003F4A0B86